MYTLSSKLKLTAIIFMIVGALGLIYGFIAAPSTIEDVKEMMAYEEGYHESADTKIIEDDTHSANPEQAEAVNSITSPSQAEEHGDEHYEHVLHQLQNKPWAALYVAALFFFMISLGVLAFYALQYASQAGWSPVLFRVMESITA